MEIWKEIEGFNGVYLASNLGNIKSIDRLITRNDNISIWTKGKILKPRPAKNGYLFVQLSRDGLSRNYSVHRLVASCFLIKTNGRNEVNHKDGDKNNNKIDNLEWCSRKENAIHASKNNLFNPHCLGKFGGLSPRSKKVIKFDKNWNKLDTYDSVIEAADANGCWRQAISKCCLGKRNTTGGYKWKYDENNEANA